jgi:hypothetical protein
MQHVGIAGEKPPVLKHSSASANDHGNTISKQIAKSVAPRDEINT